MKLISVIALFITNSCFAQQWQAELMAGVSGYSGDLARNYLSFRTLGPAVSANLKYMMPNNLIVIRGGIGYSKISGNDKYNGEDLQKRNLNFKTAILEASLCVEVNLFDPDEYEGIPYVFVGVGGFHFNPYTFDKDNKKTYLQPLGTEGQGLPAYPERKIYSLTQFCIPFGAGWKLKINERYDVLYEAGARYLFTDYLDDVSTTYADPEILLPLRGQTAVELAYRQKNPSSATQGRKRGNPGVKDWYFTTGFKILIKLGALDSY